MGAPLTFRKVRDDGAAYHRVPVGVAWRGVPSSHHDKGLTHRNNPGYN